MTVSSSLAFTQGLQVGAPGVAIIGVDGTAVVASNGNNANVVTWTFAMVDVPPGSALPIGIVQTGSSPTYTFTPDITGGYLLELTVFDSSGNFAIDYRTFQVPETSGRIIVPFKGTDASLNFIISSVMNLRGWAPFQGAYDKEVDLLSLGGGVLAGLPTRGLTSFLIADNGVFNNAGAVTEWSDQAPSQAGKFWSTVASGSNPAAFNASGFNSKATIDFLESPSQSQFQFFFSSLNAEGYFCAPTEFTIAACLQYTGTKNFATNMVCPFLFAATSNNPATGCGLVVGLDPGNSNNVIFAVFANDGTLKYAESASVPTNVAHYVVVTFSGGVLSIYLDANAAVTQGSVGFISPTTGLSAPVGIGAGGVSSSQCFEGHIKCIGAWCVGQTAGELAQTKAFIKAAGGL
jgi:hypothetical protein